MQSSLISKNEIKVFILYLFNYIRHSMTYDDIMSLTEESGFVGYFDFAEIFSILIQDKNIEETAETEENKVYAITERGRAIAENLEHLIPIAAKNRGIIAATRYLELKKLSADISYTLEDEDGGYRFKCSINNKNNAIPEIFGISLFIKEKSTA
ncbi:MAG: DUF4364 family protein, partial [Oscillospiraceae bacterium]|nr:DUF4364 family protein [Oscillospiraceae bacterium]